MPIEFKPTRALDETTLKGVERRLGVELPADYRGFLLEVNGGRPVDPNSGVDLLFPVGAVGELSELEESTISGWRCGRVPANLLAIGVVDQGRSLYIDVDENSKYGQYGRIYYLDPYRIPEGHENLHLVKPWARMKGFVRMADSFSEFMASMEKQP